ncbi:pilus assembly protein [Brenneria goodwinii]|uniref:TadE/TadG family type IV pilus assembly protein n=1 Tax=Brenneria goodwinii TaxID=1109412 RepID=UPI0036E2FD4B
MIILKRFLLTLQRDQRGAVTLTYLLCFPLILLALLGSIDFIRYSMAQGKLQNALDTAVISAGRNLDTFTPVPTGSDEELKWRADAKSYFFSNMPQGFLGSSITEEQVIVTYSEETDDSGNTTGGQLVSMSATGTLPLLVTGMINKTAFNLSAQNTAERRTRSDLEMVLALDNTGSMSSQDRIGKLKTASTQLVTTVLSAAQAQGGNSQSFIGIVPFADSVYIGEDKVHWLTDKARNYPYIKAGDIWDGCVIEPYKNDSFKAKPGLPGSFEPLMTLATMILKDGVVTPVAQENDMKNKLRDQKGIDSSKVSDFKFTGIDSNRLSSNDNGEMQFAFKADWQYTSDYTSPGKGYRERFCKNTRAMTFLDNNANSLIEKVNAMDISGGTIIPLGLLWSWRMLDPNWRGIDGWGDSDKPRDPAIGLNKVIVLLTDGNNGLDPNWDNGSQYKNGVAIDGERDVKISVSYSYRSKYCHDVCSGSFDYPLNDANHYFTSMSLYADRSNFNSLRVGNESELGDPQNTKINPYGLLFSGNESGQEDWEYGNPTLNRLTAELCTNIKAGGITIYTVVLGSGTNASTQTLMQNCSSGTGSHYFNATNVNNLPAAFAAIAASLTELRLTE